MTRLDEVRAFWESNPLWTGESSFEPGSRPFFEEHRKIYIADCFAGDFDVRFLPPPVLEGRKCGYLILVAALVFGLVNLRCVACKT